MSAKAYCSICRKQVHLVFGDVLEKDEKARWEHIDANWEHADERGSDRQP